MTDDHDTDKLREEDEEAWARRQSRLGNRNVPKPPQPPPDEASDSDNS